MNYTNTASKNLPAIIGIIGLTAVTLYYTRKWIIKKPRSALSQLISRATPESLEKIPTREESMYEGGINFIVFIRSQESNKPRKGALVTNPFVYPFEPGILIKNFGNSYRLLFNKYPIINKHLLLVTFQFEKQSDPLTKEDLEKAYEVISEINGFAFYNNGEFSGYSQDHKHIQIIPYEGISRFPLEDQLFINTNDAPFTLPMYNFKHFFHAFSKPEELHMIYNKLLGLLSPVSYNLILTQNWMLIVSRSKAQSYKKFDLNSMAYAGFLMAKNTEEYEIIKRYGPLSILADAAVKD